MKQVVFHRAIAGGRLLRDVAVGHILGHEAVHVFFTGTERSDAIAGCHSRRRGPAIVLKQVAEFRASGSVLLGWQSHLNPALGAKHIVIYLTYKRDAKTRKQSYFGPIYEEGQ